MSLALATAIHIFIRFTPLFVFFIIIFKNNLRLPLWFITCLSLCLLALSIRSTHLTFDVSGYPLPVRLVHSLFYTILFVGGMLLLVRCPVRQLLFVYFLMRSYSDNIWIFFLAISTKFDVLNSSRDILTPPALLLLGAVVVFTFPLMYLFMARYVRPLKENEPRGIFWRFLWIIPTSFYFVFRLCVSPLYMDTGYTWTRGDGVVPVVWSIATFLSYSIVLHMLKEISQSADLKEKLHLSEIRLAMQEEQYLLIQKNIQTATLARHDLRHHLLALKGYTDSKDLAGARDYLNTYLTTLGIEDGAPLCENRAVDAIIRYYTSLAQSSGSKVTTDISIPAQLPFLESDICIVLGNLIENAAQSCVRQKTGARFLEVKAALSGERMMVISVKNSFDHELHRQGDKFQSSKTGGPGVGTASVIGIAEKYGGVCKFTNQAGVFTASVLLTSPQ